MKKLDQFLLKSFIGPFMAILLVVVFILMMQFLWVYIDDLVGKGLSFKVILEFLGWGCITMLPLSLPLSTLLSSMMTLGTLGENNELLAMKAAGISLARILIPIMIASAVISIGTFFVANNLIPIAYNKIYTLRDDIGKTKEEIKIPTGTFYDGIEGYILRVDERDDDTGMMYGVMVYNHKGTKGNTSLILADSAMMKMTEDKKAVTFTMFSGEDYEETNTRERRDTTLQLQTIEFTQQSVVIPLENYAFEKSEEGRFGDQVKAMNLNKLDHSRDSIGELSGEAKARQMETLMTSKTLKYTSQIDTTKKSGIRTNFDYDNLPDTYTLEDEIKYREKALTNANEYISTLTTFSRETYGYTHTLRRINVEFLKKFATALACFIFFFIGAPLGALIRKGGLGTPAIISVLFFVLYWVIDITGTKLANDGAISAAGGVFISSYILFPLGIFLTYKAINDSSIIDTDRMKSLIKKVRNVLLGRLRKTRIVFMGTPEFAVASLDALVTNKYNVVGVVTVADKPVGRGQKISESPVKQYAVSHNIPVLQPTSLKDPEFLEALKAWQADLFAVVAFRILPKEVWEIPRLGTFNLHAALLPQYRGAAPINWALINGERLTGVTTFMINEGMDTGHIIFREQIFIEENETAGELHDKLMELGANLVVNTVDAIIDKNYELRLQKSFLMGSEALRPAPKLTKELCHIDWNDTTEHIYNLIRGLSPHPAAFTTLVREGEEPISMKIYFGEKMTGEEVGASEASAAGARATRGRVAPGKVLSDGKSYLAITTADGAISITDLQISGKKRMDVRSFLAGFREPTSYSAGKGTSADILKNIAGV